MSLPDESSHQDYFRHYGVNAENEDQDYDKYLTFSISGQRYGTDIGKIKEIIEYCKTTHVPLTPPEIHGVINLRGSVVPVVDLAARLGKGKSATGKKTCIVICEINDDAGPVEVGYLVDEVDQVIDIALQQIEEAPQFGTDIKADYIGGMGGVEESFIVLLNIDELLSVSDLSSLINVNFESFA